MPELQRSPDPVGVGPFSYRLYGLQIRSDLPLPELEEDAFAGSFDVAVRLGSVPVDDASQDSIHFSPDNAILTIANLASYRVSNGSEIVVDPRACAEERNVRLFLLGSAMGLLVHQRGLLPLHANAVEIDGRAVAFMGESGAGKSTLAAWLHEAGYRLLTDDVCVLKFDRSCQKVRVTQGLSRFRLTNEALGFLGKDAGLYAQSYVGDPSYTKFDVPARQGAGSGELDLAAIYVLGFGNKFGVFRLTGVAAMNAVYSHTYRGSFVSPLRSHVPHFDAAVELVRSTPVYEFRRSWDLAEMPTEVGKIIDHVRSVQKDIEKLQFQ